MVSDATTGSRPLDAVGATGNGGAPYVVPEGSGFAKVIVWFRLLSANVDEVTEDSPAAPNSTW